MVAVLKKYKLIFIAVILVAVCSIYVHSVAGVYRTIAPLHVPISSTDDIEVVIGEGSTGSVECIDKQMAGQDVQLTLKSVDTGRVYLEYYANGEYAGTILLFVHSGGLITLEDFFGDYTGSFFVRICVAIYLILVTVDLYLRYRKQLRTNMYEYRSILLAGFFSFMICADLLTVLELFTVRHVGLIWMFGNMMSSLLLVTYLTFPLMVAVSISIMISNIYLMRKEGRSWRNMLGFILGVLLCVASLIPTLVSSYLQRSTIIDVHNWVGAGRFIGMFIEYMCSAIVVYIDSILIGTIVMGVKASRHVPAMDKDYILILGCQIRKDGTLTKLLQGRADRAVWFAKTQKEKTGRDITFIPCGGQGSDEVTSEAEAIANYLKSIGIPESQILLEDKSVNTYENIRNAAVIIKEKTGEEAQKIAFSTTNYHVFRSGLIASNQGIKAEGIGSRTKSYFWINAFIRELIATLVSERRTHLIILGILVLINLTVVILTYFSNVVLSTG